MVKISHPYTSVRDGCELPKAFYIYPTCSCFSTSNISESVQFTICLPGKTQNSKTSPRAATGGILVSSYFYQIFSQTSFWPKAYSTSRG